MKIHPLSAKARDLMLELGAEACVIILAKADKSGESWESEVGAAIDTNQGLTWEVVGEMIADAADDAVSTPVTPQDAPS